MPVTTPNLAEQIAAVERAQSIWRNSPAGYVQAANELAALTAAVATLRAVPGLVEAARPFQWKSEGAWVIPTDAQRQELADCLAPFNPGATDGDTDILNRAIDTTIRAGQRGVKEP